MPNDPDVPPRALPAYTDLGPFVIQEIPYGLQDGQDQDGENVQVLDIRFAERFAEDLTLQIKGVQQPVRGELDRHGLFADKSRRLPDGTFTAQSLLEEAEIQSDPTLRGETYRLVRVGDGRPLEDPASGLPHQITKVIRIPYRWRRPGEPRSATRQTYLLICYTGPSSQ